MVGDFTDMDRASETAIGTINIRETDDGIVASFHDANAATCYEAGEWDVFPQTADGSLRAPSLTCGRAGTWGYRTEAWEGTWTRYQFAGTFSSLADDQVAARLRPTPIHSALDHFYDHEHIGPTAEIGIFDCHLGLERWDGEQDGKTGCIHIQSQYPFGAKTSHLTNENEIRAANGGREVTNVWARADAFGGTGLGRALGQARVRRMIGEYLLPPARLHIKPGDLYLMVAWDKGDFREGTPVQAYVARRL